MVIVLALFVFLLVFIAFLSFSYYAYRKAFFSDRNKTMSPYDRLDKRGFAPYEDRIRGLIDSLSAREFEEIFISADDGTDLYGRYYHVSDGAPLEILVHGYRGHALRDFAGGAEACFDRGHNMLLIDNRAGGKSGGKVITFGIKERFDLISWVNYAVERFGKDTDIILAGVSMGGATVLMAAGEKLPESVKCVIADCPYSSPIDIITRVATQKGAPAFLARRTATLGARIFAKFSILESSPVEAVRCADIPILIIHGAEDSFVPCYMSEEIQAKNPSIILEKIEGADHAVSYLADTERYRSVTDGFLKKALGGDFNEN